MYRNSRRISKILKRIIFILFLVIYIGGCVSTTKYNNCLDDCNYLKKRIDSLKNDIVDLKKEKSELENLIDVYFITNYKLQEDNSKKRKEITYLRKTNIVELSSEVLKIDKKVKDKLNEITSFIYDKYKIYPFEMSLNIDEEFTHICSYYFIKESDTKFDISIYTDLFANVTIKDKFERTITLSKEIERLSDIEEVLTPLFRLNITY